MSVPGRVAAIGLLLSLDPPPWFVRHARAVGEVAGWLAVRLERRDVPVDARLVESAALLHDVDKLLPPDDPAKQLPHGRGSAAWLARRGHPELGPAVEEHPVTRLADHDAFFAWLATASVEARVVAYADKRAGQRLVSMATRFRSWERRYPAPWSAAPVEVLRQHAARLEADVCALAGVAPEAVGRLRWTTAALLAVSAARRDASATSPLPGPATAA
jgi:hypothetical protein